MDTNLSTGILKVFDKANIKSATGTILIRGILTIAPYERSPVLKAMEATSDWPRELIAVIKSI